MPRPIDAELAALRREHQYLQQQTQWLRKHPEQHLAHTVHIARLQAHSKRLHALTERYARLRAQFHAKLDDQGNAR